MARKQPGSREECGVEDKLGEEYWPQQSMRKYKDEPFPDLAKWMLLPQRRLACRFVKAREQCDRARRQCGAEAERRRSADPADQGAAQWPESRRYKPRYRWPR